MENIKPKQTWFEKLNGLELSSCLPLEGTPRASVYSAMHFNKRSLSGRKFRIHTDKDGLDYVCRIK